MAGGSPGTGVRGWDPCAPPGSPNATRAPAWGQGWPASTQAVLEAFFPCVPLKMFLLREKLVLKYTPASQLSGASRCIALHGCISEY